jgi:hypothetical protein
VSEPLVIYRDHAGSYSRQRLPMAEGKMACYRRVLDRGRLTRPQQRIARARLRHFRALRQRELVRSAVGERRWGRALANGLVAVPYGVVAFAQEPGRWAEWARDLRAGSRRRR